MVGLRAWTHSNQQKRLNLKSNESIILKYVFQDLQKLDGTTGEFNRGFKLPPSKQNIEYFESFWNVNLQGGFKPKKKTRCIIEEDSIPLIDGILQLVKVVIEKGEYAEFEIRVFGNTIGLFKSIGEKKMSDYDWAGFNHLLNTGNVEASFGATGVVTQAYTGGELRYGIQDYGYGLRGDGLNGQYVNIYDQSRPIHWNSFSPYLRLVTAMQVIANQEGFYLNSSWFETAFAENVYLLNYDRISLQAIPSRDNYFKLYNDPNTGNGTITGSEFPLNWTAQGNGTAGTFVDEKGVVDVVGGAAFFDAPVLDQSLQIAYKINYSINFLSISSGVAAPYDFDIELCEEKDGVVTVLDSENHQDITPPYNLTNTVSGTLGESTPYYGGGKVFLRITINSGGADIFLYGGENIPTWWEIDEFFVGAEPVRDLGDHWGEMKAKDVFLAATRMFNLLWIPNRINPSEIEVEPYQDYINSGTVKKWNIDTSKSYAIEPLTDDESSELKFTFTEADDVFNTAVKEELDEVYGYKKIYNDENDFASKSLTITSPSHATPLNAIPLTEIMIPKLFNDKGNASKGGIRIVYYGGVNSLNGTMRLKNLADETVDLTQYNHFGHYSKPIPNDVEDFDLNFGEVQPFHSIDQIPKRTLFHEFWRVFLQTFYDERASRLKANFILNKSDIYRFKYNDKIYIPSLNSYWRIETINYNSTVEGSVPGTLLKLDENTNYRFSNSEIVSTDPTTKVVSFQDLDGNAITSTRKICEFHGGQYRNGVCYIARRNNRIKINPLVTTNDVTDKLLKEKSTSSSSGDGDGSTGEEFLTMGG